MAGSTTEPAGETAERLRVGGSALGVDLDDGQVAALCRFLGELELWNERSNLVSERDRRSLIDRHLLDSLAAVPVLRSLGPNPCIADVGSGAGLPGVPLAIALRSRAMWLIEPRRKRSSFLRSVRRALADVHLEVVAARAEDIASQPESRAAFDAVVSRATLTDRDLLACAAPLVRPGGLVVAYRGPATGPGAVAKDVRHGPFTDATVHRYELAGAERAFRLDVWRSGST